MFQPSWFVIPALLALAIFLTLLAVRLLRNHRGQEPGTSLSWLFGSAAAWAWFVIARNLFDSAYADPAWEWGTLAFALLAVYGCYRLLIWLT